MLQNFLSLSQKRLIFYVPLLCIFLCALSLRLYYLDKRVDLHVDEAMSIVISEYNDYGLVKLFDSGKIWQANQLKNSMLWNDSSIKGAFKDVAKLWKNNRDNPHTNLYYSIFRLWNIGFVSNDLKSIFYRGVSLNLVFFSLSFFFATLVIAKLIDNERERERERIKQAIAQ